MAWLDPLRAQLDLLTGRFVAGDALAAEDRDGALAVLDQARRAQVNRVRTLSVVERALASDRLSPDGLAFVRDLRAEGQIVGSLRTAPASVAVTRAGLATDLALDGWPAAELPRVRAITALAVSRPWWRTAALTTLLRHAYERALADGMHTLVGAFEPAHVPLFRQLGFRTHGQVRAETAGGFRAPMALVLHDEAHLADVGSPLLPSLRAQPRPFPAQGFSTWRAVIAQRADVEVGIEPMRVGDLPEALVEDVSLAGQTALAEQGLVLRCDLGQRIVVTDDGARTLGVVVDGATEVVVEGRTVARLGPTETFGELSVILGVGRTADVVAVAPGTRVAMLAAGGIDRVRAPADRERLWRNLARIVARRLLDLRDRA